MVIEFLCQMGTFYRRRDGYREYIRSFVIAGYLRFRSTFFLIATILFIFYTVCVILSKTANIWSPFLDSEVSNEGSERHPGQAPAEVPVIDSGKPVGNDSVIDHGKAVGNDSVIDLESSSGKDPVVDLGYPLGKNPVINLGYSKYQGNTRKDGVTTWLGIRYAAPPIGDLRFAPPKDPPKHGGIQKADKVRLFLPIALTIPLILYSVARSVGAIESLQQTLASMRTVSSWTYMFRQMYQQAPCCQCCSSFQGVASTLMLGHIQIEAVSLLLRRAAS